MYAIKRVELLSVMKTVLHPGLPSTKKKATSVIQNFSIALHKTCANLNNQQIVSAELIT